MSRKFAVIILLLLLVGIGVIVLNQMTGNKVGGFLNKKVEGPSELLELLTEEKKSISERESGGAPEEQGGQQPPSGAMVRGEASLDPSRPVKGDAPLPQPEPVREDLRTTAPEARPEAKAEQPAAGEPARPELPSEPAKRESRESEQVRRAEKPGKPEKRTSAPPRPEAKPERRETKAERPAAAKPEPARTERAAKPAPKTTANDPNRVEDMKVRVYQDHVVITIQTQKPIAGYKRFILTSPHRFVVDVYGRFPETENPTVPGNMLIKDVRTGRHKDKLRVVVDYISPKPRRTKVEKAAPDVLTVTIR